VVRVKIHKLSDGTTVGHLSHHGFKFSDGTSCQGQDKNLVGKFSLSRESVEVKKINGHSVNKTMMVLSEDQISGLQDLASQVDILIVPFPVLVALKDQGLRSDPDLDNVVAFNATEETTRSAPQDKVVDINNWSW